MVSFRTYEYPLGCTFRASTPAHAAARVFGGKPADYVATENADYYGGRFVEVFRFKDALPARTFGRAVTFVGDIPIVEGN